MSFWVSLAVLVVTSYLSYALAPSPNAPDQPKPELEDVDAPTVDTSSPVPIIYGTMWLKSANVVWYGDLRTTPIKSEGSGGKK